MGRDFGYIIVRRSTNIDNIEYHEYEKMNNISRYNDKIGWIDGNEFDEDKLKEKITELAKELSNLDDDSDRGEIAEAICAFSTVLKELYFYDPDEYIALIRYC